MGTDPLEKLRGWLSEAESGGLRVPHATILSTIGLDGSPNARGLAIKAVTDLGIVITGPLDSRKGRELAADPRCALTCWWDSLGRQVRIQGTASILPEEQARALFAKRPWEARVIAEISEQGKPMVPGELERAYVAAAAGDPALTMPASWGGWVVDPIRIEFMEFSDSRFHARELHERVEDGWTATLLQP